MHCTNPSSLLTVLLKRGTAQLAQHKRREVDPPNIAVRGKLGIGMYVRTQAPCTNYTS